MLRFVKNGVPSLKLCSLLFDNLLGKPAVFTETVSKLTINNGFSQKGVILKNRCGNFCTSITPSDVEKASDEPNIAEIAKGNPELEHKLRVLILEAEVWRQEGKPVPQNSSLRSDNWRELLNLPTKSARRRYLEFLFKVEKKKENRLKKKEQKRVEWEQIPKLKKEGFDVSNYNLGHNSFLLRIYETTINQMYNNRLIQAIQFGQKLVIDCGYYENMTSRENTNCSKQLMLLFAENRISDDPFDLHYCNAVHDSNLMQGLQKFIPTMYEPSFPLNFHEASYLDVFPKEKLIYLTPHCREEMTEYDHDAIYIVGAIVDKVNNEPLSLAKAKKEGLRMAKLPLDRYLDWGAGSGKSLTINQVASILLDVKRTGDWKYALRHVPRRKLAEFGLASAERKFNNRISYIKESRKPSIPQWKPKPINNFDKLNYGRRETADGFKRKGPITQEHKSTARKLIDVRKVIHD